MLYRLSGAIGLASILSSNAAAQEVLQADIQRFEPAYFARYNPNTAFDMVSQVPGFSVDEGDNVRGFAGAAGNVLINNERPSTKTSLRDLLGRIPAGSVLRIDLVTGPSAGLDMRGQTKVVNVIARDDALAQPITFNLLVRGSHDGRIQGQLEASTQREFLGGQLTLSGEVHNRPGMGPSSGAIVISGREKYDPAGVSFEHGVGFTQQQPFVRALNFEYQRDMGWGAVRLNGGATLEDEASDRYFELYTPDAQGPLTGIETNRTRGDEHEFTLGGDVERSFGDSGSAKLITFHRREEETNEFLFSTFTGAGSPIAAVTNRPEFESGESILRGQVNWKLGDNHSIEIAAETAYNFLESGTELFVVDGLGVRADLILPGSNTKVEEFRNEYQISDVWTVSPDLTIEPGFKFETSRIVQDENERELEYPKPSLTATWRINPQRQLRLSYVREVAQLSFGDFVSSIELVNDQTTGGNTEVVPEQTWAFNAELEQRFWRAGVLTLFGSYDEVEDVEDFVRIFVDDDNDDTTPDIPVDAPGNIGDGTRWRLGFRSTIPLDNLGLPGARLDASLSGGGSEVVDPITGRTREFSDEFKENWSLEYRQDFPTQKWSYGFRLNDGGPATAYRFNELSRRFREDMDFDLWVESSRWLDLNIRAGFSDLFAADYTRTRVIHAVDRTDSTLERIEQSHSSNGVIAYIRISGTL